MHSIYLIQNNKNLKIYIGQSVKPKNRWVAHKYIARTITDPLLKRRENPSIIHFAIAKYGEENFIFNIIEEFERQEECNDAEIFWISFFQSSKKEFGYNVRAGGKVASGWEMPLEQREKISKSLEKIDWPDDITLLQMAENNDARNISKQLGLKDSSSVSRRIKKIELKNDSVPKLRYKANSGSLIAGQNKFAKLKSIEVLEIVKLKNEGFSTKELSIKFNVATRTINCILSGERWGHLTKINTNIII